MKWIFLLIGILIGMMVGVMLMCLLQVGRSQHSGQTESW